MPDYSNNFNNLNNALLSNKNNATTRSGFGIGGATKSFQNSVLNLSQNVQGIAAQAQDLFSAEADVINQNLNLMRGNHYVPGYERVPIPPLPPIDPFSPPQVLENFLPPVANEILGLSQDIRNQPLVEYDMENFKYSLDKTDEYDFWYEDPLYVSFDLIFDRTVSPLFNGEIYKFFEVYATNDYLKRSKLYYTKFEELFFKIFNGIGPKKYTTVQSEVKIPGTDKFAMVRREIPQTPETKRNKVWYINSIAGLDKITAKIPKYGEDKITITLSEDIAMMVQYMIDAYNSFAYNYTEQRYNLPDNLMRFKMMIRISDMRTMKLTNHFEVPEYMYDKATEIYTLYDCNFDFFNSKNFGDEISNGGWGASKNDTASSVKFDIIYKSIKKEFRTPLIKGEKNNLIDNKETITSLGGNKSLNDIFRDKLGRTQIDELSLKDILSASYGTLASLNNMLQNYIPKFQPNLPILPPDIMGSVYDNTILPPTGGITNNLSGGDIVQDDPLAARQNLISRFTKMMNGKPLDRVLPKNIGKDLGYDYKKITTAKRKLNLGYDYKNNGTPKTPDLGFIALFLRPPQTGPLGKTYENIGFSFGGDLGNSYENTGFSFGGDLGNSYENTGNIFSGNLGNSYENTGNVFSGDLGIDYENLGIRTPLDYILLFNKTIKPTEQLGSVYTNLYELREIQLNNLYDNTVERQLVTLGDLYNNIVKMTSRNLGVDFDNEAEKPISQMGLVYEKSNQERDIQLNKLYEPTRKPETPKMSPVYDNIGERQTLTDSVLFDKQVKPITENMGSDFINNGQRNSQDLGDLYGETQKPITQDMGYDFVNTGERNPQDLGDVFSKTEKPTTQDMGNVYVQNQGKPEIDLNPVYENPNQNRNMENMGDVYKNDGQRNMTELNLLYNNDVEKPRGLDGDSVYSNIKLGDKSLDLGSDFSNESLQKQKLDGENVYEEPSQMNNPNLDLGEDYENNLIV